MINPVAYIKFRLSGRSVPAIKVADIGEDGRVLSLQMIGEVKDLPNGLVDMYYSKAWEKQPNNPGIISIIDKRGNDRFGRIVHSSGRTVDLYIHPFFKDPSPNNEDIIGDYIVQDILATAIDLGKSMRNLLIGLVIGILLGWLIFAPMFNRVMS